MIPKNLSNSVTQPTVFLKRRKFMSSHVNSPGRRAQALLSLMCLALLSTGFAFGQNQHSTATPIKHVVVIFQENVSFDHYFATYPNALNPAGDPRFSPRADMLTPSVNGLSGPLLTRNPNTEAP